MLVQFDNCLRAVPQSHEGNNLLENEDREEPFVHELPRGLQDDLRRSVVDATNYCESNHPLVECVVAEEIELIEQTNKEQGVGNDVVEPKNIGTLLVDCLVALSHKRSTRNQNDEESSPVHLNPVAYNLKDQEQSVVVFLLRIQVGEGKIQRASAETITNHIQHRSKVRTYTLNPRESLCTLIELSRAHSVKSVQNVADEIEDCEHTSDQAPFP